MFQTTFLKNQFSHNPQGFGIHQRINGDLIVYNALDLVILENFVMCIYIYIYIYIKSLSQSLIQSSIIPEIVLRDEISK
jgi:hypothetical protein